MRPLEDVAAVLELSARGFGASAIARRTGIPRGTVRDWVTGRVPKRGSNDGESCEACGGVAHRFGDLPPEYVYLLGLYLGDGCISPYRRGVYKLRINLDLRYPGIIDACEDAIRAVDPGRRVHRLKRRSNYTGAPDHTHVEVSAYWKSWHACSRSMDRAASTIAASSSSSGSGSSSPSIPSSCFAVSFTPTAVASSTPAGNGDTRATRSATGLTTSSRSFGTRVITWACIGRTPATRSMCRA